MSETVEATVEEKVLAFLDGRKALTNCLPLYEIIGVKNPKFRCETCFKVECVCQKKKKK